MKLNSPSSYAICFSTYLFFKKNHNGFSFEIRSLLRRCNKNHFPNIHRFVSRLTLYFSQTFRTLCNGNSQGNFPHYYRFNSFSDWIFSVAPKHTNTKSCIQHKHQCNNTMCPSNQYHQTYFKFFCPKTPQTLIHTHINTLVFATFLLYKSKTVLLFEINTHREIVVVVVVRNSFSSSYSFFPCLFFCCFILFAPQLKLFCAIDKWTKRNFCWSVFLCSMGY